ncbi:MAG: hypothetical protein QGH33_03020 [Pirellulaceae bacterium]|nr:hypothetical protein [Pirellulaceae bacterium]MDP7305916.1 hypothetical protein [Pirellulaceae bacterium]HJN07129.1 hypothetical protein [Pirellulaceae bacterium]
MLALLDGLLDTRVGPEHEVEYVLQARIVDSDHAPVKTIELAPDGDGLQMGLTGWWRNEFLW